MVTTYDRPLNGVGSKGITPPNAVFGGDGNSAGYLADGRRAWKKAKAGEINYARLFESMRASRKRLERFRRNRMEAVRQYAGDLYGDGGADTKVVVNLLSRFVRTVSRHLVPDTPRVMLSTRSEPNIAAVAMANDWENDWFKKVEFGKTLERCVTDGLFGLGIMWVALGTPADAAAGSYGTPAGVPIAETIDLDDFSFDPGCRDFRKARWIAHRVRVPLEAAEQLDYFDKKARKKLLQSAGVRQYNEEGDERIEQIFLGTSGREEIDAEPMAEMWQVYVPHLRKVYTFASDGGNVPSYDEDCRPLAVQNWVGPDCGPYHFLSFKPMVGSAMPGSITLDLFHMADSINRATRKLINQLGRQKEVLPVSGAQLDDSKRLVQTADGEAFSVDNPEAIRPVSYGGPNPICAQYTGVLGDVFNAEAGNLNVLSGSSAEANTATQEKLLNANAGGGVADMQKATVAFTSKVMESLTWYWWYHPREVMKLYREVPGTGVGVERKLYPGVTPPGGQEPPEGSMRRTGSFDDLRVRVDPYSLIYRTPEERVTRLLALHDKLAPLTPILAKQGVFIDYQFLVGRIGELWDEPDITRLFTVMEPQELSQQGGGKLEIGAGGENGGEYIRRSVGQDTAKNRYAAVENAASSMASQQQPQM